jgi:hypothetical protein
MRGPAAWSMFPKRMPCLRREHVADQSVGSEIRLHQSGFRCRGAKSRPAADSGTATTTLNQGVRNPITTTRPASHQSSIRDLPSVAPRPVGRAKISVSAVHGAFLCDLPPRSGADWHPSMNFAHGQRVTEMERRDDGFGTRRGARIPDGWGWRGEVGFGPAAPRSRGGTGGLRHYGILLA